VSVGLGTLQKFQIARIIHWSRLLEMRGEEDEAVVLHRESDVTKQTSSKIGPPERLKMAIFIERADRKESSEQFIS